PGLIAPGRLENLVCVYCQAVFNTAPSMTTPACTYFHRATNNLRASATLALFLARPPLACTRAVNHWLNADCGRWHNHTQDSWIIVARSRGLPAFETPCSCSMVPLCQGVGASPAYAATCRRLSKWRNSPSVQRMAANSRPMPLMLHNIAPVGVRATLSFCA